jgi:hypothetical protein
MKDTLTTAEHVGYAYVDSGQIMLGDPCYLRDWAGHEFTDVREYRCTDEDDDTVLEYHRDFPQGYDWVIPKYGLNMNDLRAAGRFDEVKHPPSGEYSYDGACQATIGGDYGVLGGGKAVAVRAGYGDGSYPVHVTRNEEGRIATATITFIEEGEDT